MSLLLCCYFYVAIFMPLYLCRYFCVAIFYAAIFVSLFSCHYFCVAIFVFFDDDVALLYYTLLSACAHAKSHVAWCLPKLHPSLDLRCNTISLVPRPSARRGKAWYTLFAHALDFPNIPGIPYHARISLRCYTSLLYTLA